MVVIHRCQIALGQLLLNGTTQKMIKTQAPFAKGSLFIEFLWRDSLKSYVSAKIQPYDHSPSQSAELLNTYD